MRYLSGRVSKNQPVFTECPSGILRVSIGRGWSIIFKDSNKMILKSSNWH